MGPDLRLVPAAALTWAMVWWATGTTARPVLFALGGGVLAVALTALTLWRAGAAAADGAARVRLWSSALTALAVATAGLAGAAVSAVHRAQDPLVAWAADGAPVTVTGRLSGDPAAVASGFPGAGGRWAVPLAVETATARGRVRGAGGTVVVLAGPSWQHLSAGQHVTGRGHLVPADRGDSAVALLSARSAPLAVRPGSWPWRAADRLRAGLRDATVGLPEAPGGLLPALVEGDTSRVPDHLTVALRTAGLTHLTAVSGPNACR